MKQGTILGARYRLDAPLGRGGMGEVWRATDERLRRSVAVKLIRAEIGDDERTSARLLREAETAGTLQHPGITVVHDVGEHREAGVRVLYLVMELLEGRDLRAVLDGAPGGMPVPRAASLTAQVADALAAAHARGVVHRDVKPANLFLLPGDRVKICDFGIAHLADAATRLTMEGGSVGTPRYMAPEQFTGGESGPRSDLYSLGCVLHELLTGAPPFAGTGAHLMYQHMHEPPPPLPPHVPEGLGRLVQDLLAKDPAARPGSAANVADRLGPYAAEQHRGVVSFPGVAPSAQPTVTDGAMTVPAFTGAPKRSRRRPVIVAVAAATAVAAAAVAGTVALASDKGSHRTAAEPTKRTSATGAPAASGPPKPVADPYWQVVVSPDYGVAYDVPYGWQLEAPGTLIGYGSANGDAKIGAFSVAHVKQENGSGDGCYLSLAGVRGGKGLAPTDPARSAALAKEADTQARTWAHWVFGTDARAPVLDAGKKRTLTLHGGIQAQAVTYTVLSVPSVHDACNAVRPGARLHVLTATPKTPGSTGLPLSFAVFGGPKIRDAPPETLTKIFQSLRPYPATG
ncbi:serine/threonine-protein kinase [Actinomadura oligospora]|uniref:serine/threonine-protein kinase n=1 Tax=Actinomadura oligospora TaxID=111804 RepID=UPI000A0743E0|nr:serine/threonine-protein kinase [Actinomadura oligospora]